MPSDKKILSFIDQLLSAYALDVDIVKSLPNTLSVWSERYQKIYQSLFQLIKDTRDNSKSLQASLLHVQEDLHLRLSNHLTENDLQSILTDGLMLRVILSDTIWQTIVQKAYLSPLDTVIEALINQKDTAPFIHELIELKEEISSLLPDRLQQPVWLFLHDLKKNRSSKIFFTEQGSSQLIAYTNYLLKRQLGQSLNDAHTQMLWADPTENHWMANLLSHIDTDLQKKALEGRIVSTIVDFFDFGLSIQSIMLSQSLLQEFPVYWQDTLNVLAQGIQTSLFSPLNDNNSISGLLNTNTYTAVTLDLRKPIHPYQYARKSIKYFDAKIKSIYQNIGFEGVSIRTKDRMVFWAMEKLDEQGLVLIILPSNILEDNESLGFRSFLSFLFQEIYVLDLNRSDKEGLVALFMIKKGQSNKEFQDKIRYTQISFKDFNEGTAIDFDDISWQSINTKQQNYWIGLPESDFFDLIPLYGSVGAIFKNKSPGLETFMDQWLIDDNPQRLAKKVKELLKLYAKGEKKEENLSAKIKWPEALRKMARAGVKIPFDKQKIKRILLKPFVFSYIYVEEKFLSHPESPTPTLAYDAKFARLYALNQLWHHHFFEGCYAFPLYQSVDGNKTSLNINDAALLSFQKHYKQQTKTLDQTFIIFPPENISSILDKIESVSHDLPVIRKYPNQISQLLEEARYFTSDVELLTPPYEKIDEFKRKVLKLEKDAIERKVIYQRVKSYIDELKEQLASLTREHDEIQKDYEAVSKENIFYYTYAVLHDPNYKQKYHSFLQKELPRIPLYPKFRQWVNWGKAIFQAHTLQTASEELSAHLQLNEEKQDKVLSKAFTYQIEEDQGVIELKALDHISIISNIPEKAFNVQFEGKSPFVHYLDNLSQTTVKSKKINARFHQPLLEGSSHIFENIKHICSISMQLSTVQEEMKKKNA